MFQLFTNLIYNIFNKYREKSKYNNDGKIKYCSTRKFHHYYNKYYGNDGKYKLHNVNKI